MVLALNPEKTLISWLSLKMIENPEFLGMTSWKNRYSSTWSPLKIFDFLSRSPVKTFFLAWNPWKTLVSISFLDVKIHFLAVKNIILISSIFNWQSNYISGKSISGMKSLKVHDFIESLNKTLENRRFDGISP